MDNETYSFWSDSWFPTADPEDTDYGGQPATWTESLLTFTRYATVRPYYWTYGNTMGGTCPPELFRFQGTLAYVPVHGKEVYVRARVSMKDALQHCPSFQAFMKEHGLVQESGSGHPAGNHGYKPVDEA
jgi:hypothetical protein